MARQKLISRIEELNRESSRYIPIDQAGDPDGDDDDSSIGELPSSEDESDDDDLAETDHMGNLTYETSHAETMFLNLPSELGISRCKLLGIRRLARRELRLRRGQANDILHQLRIELGYKAFIYRTDVRNADSQQTATRTRKLAEDSNKNIQRLKRVYNHARKAMVRLGASENTLEHYQVISDEDLHVSTAIREPRVTNAADTELSWIWTVDARNETDHSDWMKECK
jgi:hypothetical protein